MSPLRSQRGFTLIELVAIIVIFSVLASIAVPKYLDVTREAQNRAAIQAVSEGKARLSLQYARFFLLTGAPPSTASLTGIVNANTNAGDYSLNFTAVDTLTIRIDAAGKGSVQGVTSGLWLLPR